MILPDQLNLIWCLIFRNQPAFVRQFVAGNELFIHLRMSAMRGTYSNRKHYGVNMFNRHHIITLMHWGRDKAVRRIFMEENDRLLVEISLNYAPESPVVYASTVSGTGLRPTRRQAIIWTNCSIVYWHIHVCHLILQHHPPALWKKQHQISDAHV